MSDNFPIPDFDQMARKSIREIRVTAEVEGVTFFKANFERQGFLDQGLQKWEIRKGDIDTGRAILMKSAALRDSIDVFDSTNQQITFGSDEPYAAIHNEGGTIVARLTPKMRKFFWAMFYKSGQERWKWMALTSRSELRIKIPQRKFIGESATLMRELEAEFTQILLRNFKVPK